VRRCIHCGGRTHAPGQEPSVVILGEGRMPAEASAQGPTELVPVGEEEAVEGGPPGSLRIVSALVWILIALAGGLYRVCSG